MVRPLSASLRRARKVVRWLKGRFSETAGAQERPRTAKRKGPVRHAVSSAAFDMSKMIFVTGFARGGTSWLRSCIAEHPLVQSIPGEMPVFQDYLDDPEGLESCFGQAVAERGLSGPYFVNKAPANAPYLARTAANFPQARFLFIIRDPRDVLVSHQRGNQSWMRGANSTVDGCMQKLHRYYSGYPKSDAPNVMLVRYEDLHQDFFNTMRRVFSFLGLESNGDLLRQIYFKRRFSAVTGRVTENRDSGARKGVIGDWGTFLSTKEIEWYKAQPFWRDFLRDHGYSLDQVTYERILKAIADAGFKTLSVSDLLVEADTAGSRSLVLLHDVDLLTKKHNQEWVREAARIEASFGFGSVFNFLPLDDRRYALPVETIVSLIRELSQLNPRAEIGLHLNATERFFPPAAPDVRGDHPDLEKAVAYLHEQVNEYAKRGVAFRVATAHGYGRGKKLPNNRDTPVFSSELQKLGIALFDTKIHPGLKGRAPHYVRMNDVGGFITVRGLEGRAGVDSAEAYRDLPQGTIIQILTHPGNFDPRKSLPLGMRLPDQQ